jgi:hypothetical protein
LAQRQDPELASFALNARAETAVAKKISRHVFDIAELLRVSLTSYNLRVWVVEVVGLELVTHHPVIEPVSEIGVGNGIFRGRDGGWKSAFFVCRDRRRDEDELEEPAICGTNARFTGRVRYLKTAWWCAQSDTNRSRPDNGLFTRVISRIWPVFEKCTPILVLGSIV